MGRPRLRDRPLSLNNDNTPSQIRRRAVGRSAISPLSPATSAVPSPSSCISLNSNVPVCTPQNQMRNGAYGQYQDENTQGRVQSYWDCGDADHVCSHCDAMVWYAERTLKHFAPSVPRFSLCCGEGNVILPLLMNAPQPLLSLLNHNSEPRSSVYRDHIKVFNSLFSMTSTGGRVCSELNDSRGPYAFRLNGHNHHRIGSLIPTHDDGRPRFAQLYIYDTAHEIDNRFYALRNCVPSSSAESIFRSLVVDLLAMLDENNVLVQAFRMARERFDDSSRQPVRLRLLGTRNTQPRQYNLPTASEVAALIPSDGNPTDSRDILIQERDTYTTKRISELHPSYMSLQYPLLFPYGEDGYHPNIPLSRNTSARRKSISLREYYRYRLHVRDTEARTLHLSGRLFQTYVVDAYSAVLESELDWYRRNQATIRSDLYNGLYDHVCNGETTCEFVGRRVILPASFTGGPRYMLQQYQDAMAICRWAGTPDLFITMTCNPRWPEVDRHISATTPGRTASDRPDILARVFKIRLDELIKDLRKKIILARRRLVLIYTIEFQKRGLPHCHALLFLEPVDKIGTTEDIDRYISAELPSELQDPAAFAVISKQMMHGPCGELNPSSPCMHNQKCTKGYPKNYCDETFIRNDGWPCYKRPNNSRTVRVGSQDIRLDNRYVVPYNRDLLVKYGCHINVEWCNQGMLVKYLFTYLNKGPDRATAVLEGPNSRTSFASLLRNENEIEEYINCRYISAIEACWKLFSFDMNYRSVAVERLPFHEEGCNRVYFRDDADVADVAQRSTSAFSKFTAWMEANRNHPEGRNLTYVEYPTHYTWHEKDRQWMPRYGGNTIGRIYHVNPSMGEKYYLRLLLNVVRGPRSFKEIRTVDGVEYPNYMLACKALSLLGDDVEWVEAIREAYQWKLGNQLRELFVTILLFCTVSDQSKLFYDCLEYLSEDVAFKQRELLGNQLVVFTDEEILNYTLLEINSILNNHNKSLADFPTLPQLDPHLMDDGSNGLIIAEKTYNVQEEAVKFNELHSGLNAIQRQVFDAILDSVNNNNGGVFFVYGSGGTGKTYLWRTLIACLRSRRKIVLSVASSGIASMLLPGGRTAHSRFRIPIDIENDSCCSIDYGSNLAQLINAADLIIWDEAPLQHRYAFEAVDRTFRDVCRDNMVDARHRVFGGKVVVLGGDFRQILPVVPHAPRSQIVASVVNKSDTIWNACKVFHLTTNMRLHNPNISGDSLEKMKRFSNWILAMGAGRLPTISLVGEDEPTWIKMPNDLLIPVSENPIGAVVSNTFPDILERVNDIHYLKERCILCPTNDEVDKINLHVLEKMPGELQELLSADEICQSTNNYDEMCALYPPEFLNTLNFSGISNHRLQLKIGAPVILMRNLNLQKGLCNGTRLVVTQISRRVIEAVIITGTHVGEKAFIGRIDMTPTNTCWPFSFKRRQFPIKVCFAMTINKSQGQTFKHVCAYLVNPVFTHGQLYVVASRVTSRDGLRFYIDNTGKCNNNLTRNVVYKEVFYNLPSVATRGVM
ncbi:putative DNA helicase [Helianthus annuus]|uniref:ATP-dependent DNA helicase n=1 Tax=Helianthus annuus TaxID=4232 RepID=A0A9K3NB18_HELAN|nr:putative DNA helicase [Helianthus annuus]